MQIIPASASAFLPFGSSGTIPTGYTGAMPGTNLNVQDMGRTGNWTLYNPTLEPNGSTDGIAGYLDNTPGGASRQFWNSRDGQVLRVRVRRAAAYAGIGRVRVDGGAWVQAEMNTSPGEYVDLTCSAPLAVGDHLLEFEWVAGLTLIDHFLIPAA